MKSILTHLAAFVLFGLALTSTSCKKCSKCKPASSSDGAANKTTSNPNSAPVATSPLDDDTSNGDFTPQQIEAIEAARDAAEAQAKVAQAKAEEVEKDAGVWMAEAATMKNTANIWVTVEKKAEEAVKVAEAIRVQVKNATDMVIGVAGGVTEVLHATVRAAKDAERLMARFAERIAVAMAKGLRAEAEKARVSAGLGGSNTNLWWGREISAKVKEAEWEARVAEWAACGGEKESAQGAAVRAAQAADVAKYTLQNNLEVDASWKRNTKRADEIRAYATAAREAAERAARTAASL
jgi:hypothetical protein